MKIYVVRLLYFQSMFIHCYILVFDLLSLVVSFIFFVTFCQVTLKKRTLILHQRYKFSLHIFQYLHIWFTQQNLFQMFRMNEI